MYIGISCNHISAGTPQPNCRHGSFDSWPMTMASSSADGGAAASLTYYRVSTQNPVRPEQSHPLVLLCFLSDESCVECVNVFPHIPHW